MSSAFSLLHLPLESCAKLAALAVLIWLFILFAINGTQMRFFVCGGRTSCKCPSYRTPSSSCALVNLLDICVYSLN